MKKIITVLFLIISFQGIAETIVKGTYESKKERYVKLTETFIKEINLSYTLPTDKDDIVTYKGKDYDILVNKNDLLEVYNRGRTNKIEKIKNKISYKDKKFDFIHNDFAELIEANKAVVYDKKNDREIKYLIKVKYGNAIYYDEGRGSYYDGYKFYIDKEWTESALNSDIITPFGVAIHSSLGDNPYNRELNDKEKKYILENDSHFKENKELYERAVQNPNVTQSYSY